MIFLSSVAATLVFFDLSGDIIHIHISTYLGVEPTNAASAPSTATSDVLSHYTIEASPKKDAQVALIMTPDAAAHIFKELLTNSPGANLAYLALLNKFSWVSFSLIRTPLMQNKGSLTVWALYAYFSDSHNAAFGLLVWCM